MARINYLHNNDETRVASLWFSHRTINLRCDTGSKLWSILSFCQELDVWCWPKLTTERVRKNVFNWAVGIARNDEMMLCFGLASCKKSIPTVSREQTSKQDAQRLQFDISCYSRCHNEPGCDFRLLLLDILVTRDCVNEIISPHLSTGPTLASMELEKFKENLKSTEFSNSCHI